MDSSIRHVSDLCDPLFSLLFQFLLSLLHAYPYSKISETLSNSLSSSQTCLRVSLSLMPKKKPLVMLRLPLHRRMNVNQQCSSTHPNVIRSGNQIYEKKNFFAKDQPFVSFITLKIIYFFHFFFFFLIKSDPFIVEFFEIFIMGMKPSTSRVCVCPWPRTGWWRFC